MAGDLHYGALILAAGESTRMGTDKALLPWPLPVTEADAGVPPTLLAAAILALRPLAREVFIVAGRNAAELTAVVTACEARLVVNEAPWRGQFSSLQTGLRKLVEFGCEAAFITPVDCPPLGGASLGLLRQGFESAVERGAWAVVPENNGRHGHPLVASWELMEAFLAEPETSNAREVLHAHPHWLKAVSVPERLTKAGLNTPEEYVAFSVENTQPIR